MIETLELIETLWNVNIYWTEAMKVEFLRINRNIVECKSACIASATSQAIELIETLWNVNIINQWDFTLAFWN